MFIYKEPGPFYRKGSGGIYQWNLDVISQAGNDDLTNSVIPWGGHYKTDIRPQGQKWDEPAHGGFLTKFLQYLAGNLTQD